ncbi:hypothetical protein AB833_20960 [Chromatiales bacterium (ex Bugula neritina AB1)]|nr:hypothetical protein AB833_20960 [Chromatiales bacterium (ex Bugula neritina AB1)]
MKKIILIAACVNFSQAIAGSAGVNTGSSMTMGPSSSVYSMQSATNNPAMSSILVQDDQAWRFSYFPSFGISSEIGDVDNFSDDLDELIDIIDDPASTQESASQILSRFNTTLEEMGESGYLKTTIGVGLPLPTLIHRSDRFGSSFGISASIRGQAGLRVLDSALNFDEQNGTFSTGTSLYLKSGIERSVSFSYSKPLLERANLRFTRNNVLYGGVSARVISMALSKQVTPLQQLDGRDVSNVIKNEYDSNLNESLGVGLNVGLVWDAVRYRVGLTIDNLNSPSFDYGDIGTNCQTREENTVARSNCEAAAQFIQEQGALRARETHTMSARTRVDGLYHLTDRWIATGSVDLAEYNDIVGFENQWVHVATSYEFDNNIVPSIRAGLQQNLAGEKLGSFNFGMNLFKYVSLDFEYGLESTSVNGSSTPRRFGVALGVEERF